MVKLEELNLKKNPFEDLTANPLFGSNTAEGLTWFGHSELKAKFDEIYENLKLHNPRQVVLNWGPYGGGKTFASYYYLSHELENVKVQQIYVRSPKQGKNGSSELYKSILEFISYRKINAQIKFLLDAMGEDAFFDFINSKIRSEELTEAIILIGKSADTSSKQLMRRYLNDGLTKSELKEIGLVKNVDSITDNVKLLSGIFHCFIGDKVNYDGRVVLWIDEMEDMIYFSQKEYRSFSQVLRDLMDSMNQHFCLFLNFTLSESDERNIRVLLGEALWSRITKKIRFQELTIDNAKNYCKEALEDVQIEPKENIYYPFEKEALSTLLNNIPEENLTPREINRLFGGAINYALKHDKFIIDNQTSVEYLNSQTDDDF